MEYNMADSVPLVSTILSCYNSARYLQQTLDSVRAQTYPNWELIAVDDCSKDNTRELLRAAAADDPRIRVIEHTQNGGRPAITRNTGLAAARGDFIQFIDHDDTHTPEKTETLLRSLLANPGYCVAFGNLRYMDENGHPMGLYLQDFLETAKAFLSHSAPPLHFLDERFFIHQVLRDGSIHTNSCLIARKRVTGTALTFATDYVICEDTDLWVRLGMTSRLLYVDEIVGHYRILPGSITSNKSQHHRDAAKLMTSNLERLKTRLTASERRSLRRRLANVYDSLGWTLRKEGRHSESFSAYLRAVSVDPTLSRVVPALKAWLPTRNAQ